MKVTAVIGAQYGSEGKGAVVQEIAHEYSVHVRTGGPNAGHTIYYQGKPYAMQVIPCGWVNPEAILIIGRGALVDCEQLDKELSWIEPHFPDIRERIFIDMGAGYLHPHFQEMEGGTKGELHKRIGSTGKGVGAARHARMERDPARFKLMADAPFEWLDSMLHYDTTIILDRCRSAGNNILLEGAQGHGLSLIHGQWPYVTSSDTGAAQMLADCGLSPMSLTDVILVARTFPIRVAGNSGPLEREITWDDVSARVGHKVEERTTVTKKIRRVAEWSSLNLIQAARINGCTSIALTFADYMWPKCAGVTKRAKLPTDALVFIEGLNTMFFPAKVDFVGTGPNSMVRMDQ